MVTVSAANPGPGGPVVLIGPLAAGKSTVGAELARVLGVPMCSVDEVRWRYFEEIGYDGAEAERCFARGRTPAEKLAYGMPFEVYAIEQIMAYRSFGVIDFGASNSVYDDAVLLGRVEAALTGAYVVLLLPSKDPVTSEQVLAGRLAHILQAKDEEVTGELLALNSYFVRHPANRRLARKVVYTSDRSPTAIASEIALSWTAGTPCRPEPPRQER